MRKSIRGVAALVLGSALTATVAAQQPAGAPSEKSRQAESITPDVFEKNSGYQITRDHEKDIDANKAATECLEAGMEQDHWQHRYSTKPIDLSSVIHRPLDPLGCHN